MLGDGLDQGLDRRRIDHIEHLADATAGQSCGNLFGTSRAGGGSDHGGALLGQQVGDGRANPATGTGDQGDLAREHLIHVGCPSVCLERGVRAALPMAR